MIAVRILLWLIIIGVLSSPVVAWFALDDQPLVTKSPSISLGDLKEARAFLNQYDPRNLPDGRVTRITANQRQINTALATALSAAPRLKARIVPSRYGLLAAITGEAPWPSNPFGRYVNIRLLIESSTQGLKIGRLSVGEIEVPTFIVRPVFILLMDQIAGPGRGKAALETIRSIEVRGDRVTVVYRPKDGLMDELKGAAKTAVAAGDPERTAVYWQRLHELHAKIPRGAPTSLTEYISPVFALARDRSADGDAVEENKAAIIALAMFFGDVRIERFVGDIRSGRYAGLPPKTGNVRLQNRHDWVQHYLLSAALQLTGGRGFSDFIGEIKEVGDTAKASGFSFTDIAADRTGVRLAEIAAGSASGARHAQDVLARGGLSEPDMFPEVRDFPEGLTEAQFKSRYGDRGSPEFNRLIAEIDSRIARIPLYR